MTVMGRAAWCSGNAINRQKGRQLVSFLTK